jgi:hypothetical protein
MWCVVIFAMYDFDESSVLSLDEMILAFRSTLSGLAKLSSVDPPTEADVEAIVIQGYDYSREIAHARKQSMTEDTSGEGYQGIEKDAFLKFCLDTPEIMSWIEYFDDLEEYEKEMAVVRKGWPKNTVPTHLPYPPTPPLCILLLLSLLLSPITISYHYCYIHITILPITLTLLSTPSNASLWLHTYINMII